MLTSVAVVFGVDILVFMHHLRERLMAASGDTVTKAGDTFVVHMDREALNDYPLGLYDVTVEIVRFGPTGKSPGPSTAGSTSATCTATG